jgi:hypothetical protein
LVCGVGPEAIIIQVDPSPANVLTELESGTSDDLANVMGFETPSVRYIKPESLPKPQNHPITRCTARLGQDSDFLGNMTTSSAESSQDRKLDVHGQAEDEYPVSSGKPSSAEKSSSEDKVGPTREREKFTNYGYSERKSSASDDLILTQKGEYGCNCENMLVCTCPWCDLSEEEEEEEDTGLVDEDAVTLVVNCLLGKSGGWGSVGNTSALSEENCNGVYRD